MQDICLIADVKLLHDLQIVSFIQHQSFLSEYSQTSSEDFDYCIKVDQKLQEIIKTYYFTVFF